MDVKPIVVCRSASDWRAGGCPGDSKVGYYCRGCGIELAVTSYGRAAIAEGAPPYCNDCGLTLSEKAALEGWLEAVRLLPNAVDQLERPQERPQKMTLPTPEEIKAAQEEIRRDGPMASATMELTRLVMADACLKEFVETLAANTPRAIEMMLRTKPPEIPDRAMLENFIRGAFVGGLNYGLRIKQKGKADA